MKFPILLERVRANQQWTPPAYLLSLDPGKTTGIAIFTNGELSIQSQLDTSEMVGMQEMKRMIVINLPTIVVCEDYKVYSWKSQQHSWEVLHTPQFIGMIKLTCAELNIPLHLQMAQLAKGFCNDKKLRDWGYYRSGMQHSRDAVRHGCYWLLFHKEDK